jgi:hypothetical protein
MKRQKYKMRHDYYYYTRIALIETTIKIKKNNVNRYNKHALIFCWILSNGDIS